MKKILVVIISFMLVAFLIPKKSQHKKRETWNEEQPLFI